MQELIDFKCSHNSNLVRNMNFQELNKNFVHELQVDVMSTSKKEYFELEMTKKSISDDDISNSEKYTLTEMISIILNNCHDYSQNVFEQYDVDMSKFDSQNFIKNLVPDILNYEFYNTNKMTLNNKTGDLNENQCHENQLSIEYDLMKNINFSYIFDEPGEHNSFKEPPF
ncbi:hypothetical protein DMUE_1839 [Dictyocoela muelleri]|nr:hypothetical protein DMUE_1839 [Dictyocoela muelleri]